MEKENIVVDDIREVVKLLQEYRPKVTYFTQYEYHKGYSQTNETSLELREVDYDVDEDSFYEGSELGEYESGKTLYHDNVYECEINVLKLDFFIDLLNHYIEIKGDNCDDWSFDNFFEWFHPFDGDFPDTELRYKIFDKIHQYFVHSYVALKVPKKDIIFQCNYAGEKFVAGINKGNITGFQFHPERSGLDGLRLLSNEILRLTKK